MFKLPEGFDVESKNRSLEEAPPEEVLRWAIEFFGAQLCMSTSFQLGGMVLLDMLSKLQRELPKPERVPVLFIDTGFHFPETLEFAKQVRERYDLNFITLEPVIEREVFKQIYGDDQLYFRNPTECCRINKVEPMERALAGYVAQVAALRRDTSPDRANIPILEKRTDGVFKLYPLARMTRDELKKYLMTHDVPKHPLHDRGYKSIGCFPECCTQPVGEHAPERAGRWTGTGKSECGLHLVGKQRQAQDFSI